MNKEKLRKDVYEMVWAKLTQQLKMHIAIEEDPEDDKLDDIEALISVSKYYGTFSWVLSREGQAAINLMKADNVFETPEIKANGRKVKFLDPDNLKMVVDGKVFIGKEAIDSEINRIDLIGPDMKKVRDKERIKDITKKEIKNITSFCSTVDTRT